ncbi:MAG: DNA polymerase III subunit beta [Patescibacteria group bacterium]
MNVECLKDKFHKAVFLSERHISREAHNPILQGINIEAKNNLLNIRATNLDTGFEIYVPAAVKIPGNIVIPAKSFLSLISSLSGDKIKLEGKQNTLFLKTETSSSIIKGYPADDFPPFPKINKTKSIEIPHENISGYFSKVLLASATSEIKPEISSLYMQIHKNRIKLAATDSFRLAEKVIEFKNESTYSLLFPYKHMIELVKILENINEPLTLSFNDTQAVFFSKSFSFITRLKEGSFPNYENIIPSSFSTEVKLKKAELVNSLKLASIFSSRLKEVHFNVYPEDGLFEATTKSTEIGEHISHMKAEVTGERLSAVFNYNYVMDGVLAISSDEILLRFNGDSKPVMLQSPFDASYIYLAMPMKNV